MLLFVKQHRQKATFQGTQLLALASLGNKAGVQEALKEYQALCFPFLDALTVDRDKEAQDMMSWWQGVGKISFQAQETKGPKK